MTARRPAAVDRDELAAQMIAQFRVVLREMKCVGSQRLLRLGVSTSNLHLMSMLERHGELAMSRIAEALDVSVSTATGLVDRMEERGLVERARDGVDRRVVLVRLTDGGRRALAEIDVYRDEALKRIVDQLDERQLASLASTLEDLKAAVGRVAQEDPELFAHNHQLHEAPTAAVQRS